MPAVYRWTERATRRLGWLAVPAEHTHRARAYMGNLFLTAPTLSQHAGFAAMDSRAELEGHVEMYRANRALMLDALPSLGLARIADCTDP